MDEPAAEFIPAHFLTLPPLRDSLQTQTSQLQEATEKECMPLLNAANDPSQNPFNFNEYGVPQLISEAHVSFLEENLGRFPAPFVGLDASRPWMVYWALLGFYYLGKDVTSYRVRVIKTFYSMQSKTGGFGGGYGQYSHLAGTYAVLLSLALVGGKEAYEMVDRNAMWHWLGRLKQADGGFQVCEGGEEDTRGAYCALVAISLLNLPLDLPADSPARVHGLQRFTDGLGEYLSRCQTYEGGISDAPGHEAHGAYTFCAIACLCLLDEPSKSFKQYLDIQALLSWLSARQYAPEGGLAGRTNKLVDGCYSHWLGGCWPLIQGALNGCIEKYADTNDVAVGVIYSPEGLARYILSCCQDPDGGLRDKPSKRPDSYHTCYTLAGLSVTEHFHYYGGFDPDVPFASAFAWKSVKANPASQKSKSSKFDDGTSVQAINPVYVIPHENANAMRSWAVATPAKLG